MILNSAKMSIDLASLKQQQLTLAQQISVCDDFPQQINYIGGTDVGFEEDGKITRAAIVVLSYPDLNIVDYQLVRANTEFPYIPGYLSFREYPALIEAFAKLTQKPDLLFVDGQGIAHPRRLGIASHLGLLLDTATIGVAKNKLCGQYHPPSKVAGQVTPLTDKQTQIGWVLQTKDRCNPLFVSPGHKISHLSALKWVNLCLKGYRLPEPTRWADAIASNKPLFRKWNHEQSIKI